MKPTQIFIIGLIVAIGIFAVIRRAQIIQALKVMPPEKPEPIKKAKGPNIGTVLHDVPKTKITMRRTSSGPNFGQELA
jgi:hypothetical protein